MIPIEVNRRKRGFTLVELLVTITIIIVLAALTFLAMRTIRANADMSVSIGRIRTLGMANLAYASENNGRFASVTRTPTGDPFWHMNPEFLSNAAGDAAYRNGDPSSGAVANPSPESLLDPVVVRAKRTQWNRIQASYGYNQQGLKNDGWPSASSPGIEKSARVGAVDYPEKSAMFFSARDTNVRYADRFRWKDDPVEGFKSGGGIAYRHKDRCLVVFYDGHVSALTMAEIDAQGGFNSRFWDADGS